MLQLNPLSPEAASDEARYALLELETQGGFVPNLAGLLAHSPAALNAMLGLAKAFSQTSYNAREQQVILLTASVENDCHYCVAAHSAEGAARGLSEEHRQRIRERRPLDEERLETLRATTQAVVQRRGFLLDRQIQRFLDAGYTDVQLLELMVGIASKTLSTYVNHLAATPVDQPHLPHAFTPRSQQVS